MLAPRAGAREGRLWAQPAAVPRGQWAEAAAPSRPPGQSLWNLLLGGWGHLLPSPGALDMGSARAGPTEPPPPPGVPPGHGPFGSWSLGPSQVSKEESSRVACSSLSFGRTQNGRGRLGTDHEPPGTLGTEGRRCVHAPEHTGVSRGRTPSPHLPPLVGDLGLLPSWAQAQEGGSSQAHTGQARGLGGEQEEGAPCSPPHTAGPAAVVSGDPRP